MARFKTKPSNIRYYDAFHDPKNDVYHVRETDAHGKHITDDVHAVPGAEFRSNHEAVVRGPQKPRAPRNATGANNEPGANADANKPATQTAAAKK